MYDAPKKRPADNGGIIQAVIPAKGDEPFVLARKSVFCVSFLTCLICLGLIIAKAVSGGDDTAGEALPVFWEDEYIEGSLYIEPTVIPERPQVIKNTEIIPEYLEYYEINDDVVGWIEIPGTTLDNVVTQYRRFDENGMPTGSNAYYLEHDLYHNYYYDGIIFADWRLSVLEDPTPDNTILFGHNLNNGTKFAPVARYYPYYYNWPTPHINHYVANPVIRFDTLYERREYKVFAAIYAHTEDNRADIIHDVFNYHLVRKFPDKASFYGYITDVLDRSGFYNPDVDIEYGDEIITLSTCYYPLGEHIDSRIAVFARRVRDGESPEVDVSTAWLNPSPLLYDYYYTSQGGSWGGRNWDLSMVKGLEDWLAKQG
ncbi:MAG: class B sortase [Oscillospiraceae bacterium]|nr:class B sortase [Oscillospiraceae bacterium]